VFTAIYSKSDGVLCFHYSRMRIVNDTYHVRTYERTYASSTMSRHSGAETKTGLCRPANAATQSLTGLQRTITSHIPISSTRFTNKDDVVITTIATTGPGTVTLNLKF